MDTRSATGDAPDPYTVLGVDRWASTERITSAFRRPVRGLHPDTGSGDAAEEALARVLGAHETLRAPAARAAYDRRRRPAPVPVRRVMAVRASGAGLTSARAPLLRAGPARVERTL